MTTEHEKSDDRAKRNTKLVFDYIDEVWKKLNPPAARKYKTANFVEHLENGKVITGIDPFVDWLTGLFKTMTGPMQSELQLVVAEGDYVVMRVRLKLPTTTGEFADKVFVDIFRIEGNLIAEHWAYQ